ncbi:MAG TPA: GxxExxY protein [Bacteroidia bacterium]
MRNEDYKYSDITSKVIKAFFKVYNSLGFGFLERVYENAMFIELNNMGLNVEKQKRLTVYYENQQIGNYFADFLIEEKVIIELKAVERLIEEHELQIINYLRATDLEVGLILNFGKKPEFKRKIFTNKT